MYKVFYVFCNLWPKVNIVLCVNWLVWQVLFATSTLVERWLWNQLKAFRQSIPDQVCPLVPSLHGHHCQQKTSPSSSSSSLWSWSTWSHQGFGWNRLKVYCHSSLVMVFTSLVPPTREHRRQLCDLFWHAARTHRTHRREHSVHWRHFWHKEDSEHKYDNLVTLWLVLVHII